MLRIGTFYFALTRAGSFLTLFAGHVISNDLTYSASRLKLILVVDLNTNNVSRLLVLRETGDNRRPVSWTILHSSS